MFRPTDPDEYEKLIRATDTKLIPLEPGGFAAELIRIDLSRLWMQRGRVSRSMISQAALTDRRNVIFFLAHDQQPTLRHNGSDLAPGDIIIAPAGSEYHQRSSAGYSWASMSLTAGALAEAGRTLTGRDIVVPTDQLVFRPSSAAMSRLLSLHSAASHLATTVPDILANVEVSRAIENELIRAMVACVVEGMATKDGARNHANVSIMTRFKHLLEENHDRPLYVVEICAALGVSDRTLRTHCIEYLGMTPHRYLWTRRMKLVRRALALAGPTTKTVAEIATDHGFWELGRFSVAYRGFFGEPPSATLRREPSR